jgi:hypothetical protein
MNLSATQKETSESSQWSNHCDKESLEQMP